MIKTHCLSIQARFIDGNPYYGIQWVDEDTMELSEGFNSFSYELVCLWAKTYFEILPDKTA